MPLLLDHGRPWIFRDMRRIVGPPADPAAHGGDGADAFEVIAPSLPGFGFSGPLTAVGLSVFRVADLWSTLTARLDHDWAATPARWW